MKRGATLFRVAIGSLAFGAVTLPSLIRLQHASEAAECARRRAALMAPLVARTRPMGLDAFVCPRDDTPYLFSITADSEVVARCPNGHGQRVLPLHRWVAAP